MALAETIKKQMFAAMKAQQTVEKEILRVALGEIQSAEARAGESLSDADAEKILRKLVKSNRETIAVAQGDQKQTLEREVEILEALLPKALDKDQVISALEPVADAIRTAGNDGQATGVAFKYLKAQGATVDGKTVSEAVRALRS